MASSDPQAMAEMLIAFLQPWHDAVDDPAKAQQDVLHHLLQAYVQTDYGIQHGAAQIADRLRSAAGVGIDWVGARQGGRPPGSPRSNPQSSGETKR